MRRSSSALAIKPEEVPVNSNEMLEPHVIAIRTDVADVKAESRHANAQREQDIRELRADNRMLSAKIDERFGALDKKIDEKCGALDKKIDEKYGALDKKIDEKFSTLDTKIDEKFGALDRKIDEKYDALDEKIDAANAKADANFMILDKKVDTKTAELSVEIKDIRSENKEIRADIRVIVATIAELKSMQKAMFWFLGSLGTIGAIVGLGKTLSWI